jgi:hypothetical protein
MRMRAASAFFLAALCFTACTQNPAAPQHTDAGRPRPPPRTGELRLPLPAGWVHQRAADDLLCVGPPSRPDEGLCVQRLPLRTEALRSPAELTEAFASELRQGRPRLHDWVQRPDYSAALIAIEPIDHTPTADTAAFVLLAMKRLGRELFLCSTRPGTTRADAALALVCCQQLTRDT